MKDERSRVVTLVPRKNLKVIREVGECDYDPDGGRTGARRTAGPTVVLSGFPCVALW